jgi:hypothetical protein
MLKHGSAEDPSRSELAVRPEEEGGSATPTRRAAVTKLTVGLGLSAAAILAPQAAFATGYGRCDKCNCCHFEGTQNQCSNCGHNYTDHGGATCKRPK